MCFKLLYRLYLTRLGKWCKHNKDLNKVRSGKTKTLIEEVTEYTYGDTTIYAVPFLIDNYAYIVHNTLTNDVLLVDPADF